MQKEREILPKNREDLKIFGGEMDRRPSPLSTRRREVSEWRKFSLAGLLLFLLTLLLAGCLLSHGRVRKFWQEIRPASDTPRVLRNAAYLKNSGRWDLALRELEEARLRDPGNLALLDLLIQIYEELGHFEQAEELYQEALSQGENPALENNRCFSYYLQGRLSQAEDCFRQLLRRQPDNPQVRNNLGLVLCRQGREAEALALWREKLAEAEARRQLAQALAALGKPTPAEVAANPASQPPPRPARETPSRTPRLARSPVTGPDGEHPLRASAEASPAPATRPARGDQRAAPSGKEKISSRLAGNSVHPEPLSGSPETAGLQLPDGNCTKARENLSAPVPGPAYGKDRGKSSGASPLPFLTAVELLETRLEIKNGTGIPGLARQTRNLLAREGFGAVAIGNHLDFGLRETTIAYRPHARRVAGFLAQKHFPGARLLPEGKISPQADIRISLGHDFLAGKGAAPGKTAALDQAAARPGAAALPSPDPGQLRLSGSPETVRVEVRNGNGLPGLAKDFRRRLQERGYPVVAVGNHGDFGLSRTVITYRPEAVAAARRLAREFFPQALLEPEQDRKLPPGVDLRITLGHDLVSESRSSGSKTRGSPISPVSPSFGG